MQSPHGRVATTAEQKW